MPDSVNTCVVMGEYAGCWSLPSGLTLSNWRRIFLDGPFSGSEGREAIMEKVGVRDPWGSVIGDIEMDAWRPNRRQ